MSLQPTHAELGRGPQSDRRRNRSRNPIRYAQSPVLSLLGIVSGDGRRVDRQVAHGGTDHAPDVRGDVLLVGALGQFGDLAQVECAVGQGAMRKPKCQNAMIGIFNSRGAMTDQACPKCATRFATGEGWAKSAVATLMPAPAVPDMATQVRCPKCGHVFADNEIRYQRSTGATSAQAIIWLAVIGIFVWAVYQLGSL